MQAAPAIHDTFVIRRTYPCSPARLFAAFADPAKKQRWFAVSDSHDVESFEMDFRPGGAETFRYRFREGTPFPGAELSSEGLFLEIQPERRVVTASRMLMGDHCFSASLVTIEMHEAAGATELVCTHQGAFFEGADGPEMRRAGWEALLDSLEREMTAPA